MIPAALKYPITASENVIAGRGILRGFAYSEDDSAAATLTIYDSAKSSTDRIIVPTVRIAKDGNAVVPFGSMPVAFEQGVYVVISGALHVVIYANPETRYLNELALFDDGTADMTELRAALLAAELGETT